MLLTLSDENCGCSGFEYLPLLSNKRYIFTELLHTPNQKRNEKDLQNHLLRELK